jgi:UDP-N-acetylglucosamine transferase subunit ALG13
LAAERAQKKLLEESFPGLRILDLKGYRVNYSTKLGLTILKIVFQIPKILIQIKRENRWLRDIIRVEAIDIVVSDNRYGLYARNICTVFITHQLNIQSGAGRFSDWILSKINKRFIERFMQCWVPDYSGAASLAGELSALHHSSGIPTRYIGILSRFSGACNVPILNDLLIILSGPEPQRTILERMILQQLLQYKGKVILIRGLPGETNMPVMANHVKCYNHLATREFQEMVCQSAFVISRSGYSTIMDLMILGKKSILIPTPGQREQEYLAKYLTEKRIAYSLAQRDFKLNAAVQSAEHFPFAGYILNSGHLLQHAVKELLQEQVNRDRT